MKKLLFFRAVSFNLLLFVWTPYFNSQVLLNEDFESYTLGTLHGQNNYLINFGGPIGNSEAQYQVVSSGTGKYLKITTSALDYDYSITQATPVGWGRRLAGNNILEVEYDMYTGVASNSHADGGLMISEDSGGNWEYFGNLMYNNTKRITAATWDWDQWYIYHDLGNNNTAMTLPPNQWVRLKFSYHVPTNNISYAGPGFSKVFSDFLLWPPVDFYLTFQVNYENQNADQAAFGFDNIVIKAVANETGLGTVDHNEDLSFSIYPNPADEYIVIRHPGEYSNAYLYDATGKRMDVNVKNDKIEIRGLPSGVYMLGLKTDSGFKSAKFIKK